MVLLLIKLAIMLALSYLLKPKQKFQKPSLYGLESFEIPTAEEGRSVSVLFGKKRIKGPNVVWYGDLKIVPIREKMRDMEGTIKKWLWGRGDGHKLVTVGYDYYLGMHLILCYANADGIKQIWVGEKVVWPIVNNPLAEQADEATLANVSASNVFGGKDKEGGISGKVDIQYGASDQQQNNYLVSKLDADISAYRGLLGVVLNQVYVGTSPYIKLWSFLVKRTDKLVNGSAQWYLIKAKIGNDDLNAVHIIRECLTDQEWGLGFSSDDIDDDNFKICADVIYGEGFGLSSIWDSSSTMEDFIDSILQIIAGILYQDMSTGKWKLKLIRDDYVIGGLESFDENQIIAVEEFSRPAYGEIADQVTVNWWNKINDKSSSVIVHDLALIEKQSGNVIDMMFDYQSVCDATIANKIANRELKIVSSMLAIFRIVCNRQMSHLKPGDVFKFSWKNYGIIEMPARIVDANYGSVDSSKITFQCMEDVFGLAYTTYTNPPDTEWESSVHEPVDTDYRMLMEVPYCILYNNIGQDAMEILSDDAAVMFCCAVKPVSDAYRFTLLIRLSPNFEWIDDGLRIFTSSATIKNDLVIAADDVEIELENAVDLDAVSEKDYVVIGNEIMLILSIDTDNSRVTIARGVLDTAPTAHSSGDRIWFIELATCLAQKDFVNGDTPQVKFLTKTGKGILDVEDATTETASAFTSRMTRPYLPGNLKINDQRYPKYLYGQPTLTWSHRDRTDQDQIQSIVKQIDPANYGPELGTTYTLKIYDQKNRLLRTTPPLTGTSYTYTQEDEEADSPDGHVSHKLRFVLSSVRDGYDSFQNHNITVERPLRGQINSIGSIVGDQTIEQPLQGQIDSVGSTVGDQTIEQPLQGQIDSVAFAVGSPTGI